MTHTMSLRLTDEQHTRVRQEAERRRVSQNEVIREAVDQVPLVAPDQPDREAVTYALRFARKYVIQQAKNARVDGKLGEERRAWALVDRFDAITRRMAK